MTLGKSFPFSGSLFPPVKWWESSNVSLARLPRSSDSTKVLLNESESGSVVSDSLWPHRLYSPWSSPGQNTGVGSLSLLQGIFPTQEWNPGLPHCRRILYQLSLKRSPLNSLKLKGRCLKLGVVAILRVPLDCHSWRHALLFPINASPGWWTWHRAGFMARGGGRNERTHPTEADLTPRFAAERW